MCPSTPLLRSRLLLLDFIVLGLDAWRQPEVFDVAAFGVESATGNTLSGEFMSAVRFTGESSDSDASMLLPSELEHRP